MRENCPESSILRVLENFRPRELGCIFYVKKLTFVKLAIDPYVHGVCGHFGHLPKVAKNTCIYPSGPNLRHVCTLEFSKVDTPYYTVFQINHRGDPYHRFEMHVLHLSRANHCVVILSWPGSGEIGDLTKIEWRPEKSTRPREIRDVTPIITNRVSMEK